MNKKLLALLVASSFSLYGCGDEQGLSGTPTIDPDIKSSLNAETKIEFDLLSAEKKVVTPSFIAMDLDDGTIATESSAKVANISDPAYAWGQTDGWSTTQPININFTGNDLAAETAADSFYLIKSGDPTNSADATTPEVLSADNGDFMVTASGTRLTVILTKPLDPASNYMFAVTSDLKDSKGNPVGLSNSYAVLKSVGKVPDAALEKPQAITHAVESTLSAVAGAPKNKIIFSSWFTTASVGEVLYAAKSASALALKHGAANIWQGSAIADGISQSDLESMFEMSVPTDSGTTTPGGNPIYTGTIKLPYFLEKDPTKFSSTPWQSGMPSLAKISYVLNNGSDADKAAIVQQLAALQITTEDLAAVKTDPETQVRVLQALTGSTLKLADGSQLDEERLITRYSPVPKLKAVDTVEYTLVLSSDTATCQTGSSKVSIYQHGITSTKATVAALADSVIGTECHAIFAIDHPLHGDRGIAGVGSASGPDGNPALYLNLAALTVARDNLRQSTIDVLNLRAGIALAFKKLGTAILQGDTATIIEMGPLARLNPQSKVGFVGHSLGAITGINVADAANRTLNDPAGDAAFAIDKVALANPGAGIPHLLLQSGTFGDSIKGQLLYSASTDFQKFCADYSLSDPEACFKAFETALVGAGDPEGTLATAYGQFSQFAYVAQGVLDTVDPINTSLQVSADLPVYLSQVKDDQTIPNQLILGATVNGADNIPLPYSPFGGTLPLLQTMSLSTSTHVNGEVVRSAVLFDSGTHNSLLESDATGINMRAQISSLLNNDGTVLNN
ncbi:lipase [Photobacterium sp. WH77]|uniref:VolA/Pla-1 family phospholipase n=1 Tax=unclassified Photobacterium TaxID=2628852 RepID=UPI001EDB6BB8|nr:MULTISPECIES: VolA/Pla-1 family phospholipase [unclassified Photobacterium]MCG2835790.1 lipase [Photobacterium sp. WH77]MCG2843533.1 lipase [Photobacterium sp. WH80]